MTDTPMFGRYAAAATVGSLFVAYGLREFLRAFGGGYYCCNHLRYGFVGTVTALVGWVFLLLALYGPYYRTKS